MTPPHHGSCHCGSVTLTLHKNPASMSQCNCSLCRRIAGLWCYCSPGAVEVSGALQGYVQGDKTLTTWRCASCGCTSHWTPVDPAGERMGVNLRLFDPELRANLPLIHVDGASW